MDGVSALILIFLVLGLIWLIDTPKKSKDQKCSMEGCRKPTYGNVNGKPFCYDHIRL